MVCAVQQQQHALQQLLLTIIVQWIRLLSALLCYNVFELCTYDN